MFADEMTQTPDEPKVVTADVIEAGMIVLVDDSGKRRAELSCKSEQHCEDGYAIAQLFDGDGRPRITMQVNQEGASIQLWNRSNSPCVTLNVADERGTGIVVTDSAGKSRFQAGATNNDTSSESEIRVEIVDSTGVNTWPTRD